MSYTLAIDLGGTNTKLALITKTHEIFKEFSQPTLPELGAEAACQRWLNTLEPVLRQHKIDVVGIGSPGPLDNEKGWIISTPNLKNWVHFSFTDYLTRTLHVPAFIENDAHCAALGEWSQHKVSDLVVLTLGTGVGCGVIADGKLLRGSRGWGTEAGHMTIDKNGPFCECGKRGCLEALVGGYALTKRFQTESKSQKSLTPHEIFNLAKQNDSLATIIIDNWTEALAIGVGNLINLFNPCRIVLTGGVSVSFSFVKERFQKILLTEAWAPSLKCTEVVVSEIQNKAGLLGAALWARQQL